MKKISNFRITTSLIVLCCFIIFATFGCTNALGEVDTINQNSAVTNNFEEADLIQNDYSVSLAVPQPAKLEVSRGEFADKIVLSWSQVIYNDELVKYHVYRRELLDTPEDFERITGFRPVAELSFEDILDSGLTKGVTYQYAVKAFLTKSMVSSRYSAYVDGFILGQVSGFEVSFRSSEKKINLKWNPVSGARFYIVHRSVEQYPGVVPPENSFEIVGSALVETNIDDYANTAGGDLDHYSTYYYYVTANFGIDVAGEKSNIRMGALKVPGSPAEPQLIFTTQGLFQNAIRVQWLADSSASKYSLYRILKSEFDDGERVGVPISLESDINKEFFIQNGSNLIFYDNSDAIISGETFYYRVAAENDFGKGPLSDIVDFDAKRRATGNAISTYESRLLNVRVTQQGFNLEWDECAGVNSYNIFCSSEDPSSFTADQWTYVGVVNKEISYLHTVADISSLVSGFQIDSDEMWYRIMPVNGAFLDQFDGYKVWQIEGDGAFDFLNKDYEFMDSALEGDNLTLNDVFLEVEGKKDLFTIAGFAPVWVHSDFSEINSDYTVPVPSINSFVASKLDENYKDTIRVQGAFNDIPLTGADRIKYILIRTCYYGDETGVLPLNQPNPGIGAERITYSKVGQSLPVHVVEYPLSIGTDGSFSWVDPMPDFVIQRNSKGKDESVFVESGMKWDYKHWDREAWKSILRQKNPDTSKMVQVFYQLKAERVSDPEWGRISSGTEVGYPALSTVYAGHLAHWMVDCALNRIWHVHVPRYAWNNTMSWLVSQSHSGQLGGSIGFTRSGMSGSGGTSGEYSDWVNHNVSVSGFNLSVAIEDAPRNITFSGRVNTPYYRVDYDFNLWVPNFGLHWGVCWSGTPSEYVHAPGIIGISYSDSNNINRAKEDFVASDIWIKRGTYPIGGSYAKTAADPLSNIHGYSFRDHNYYDQGDFSWTCQFTRINWKYQAAPGTADNSPWSHADEQDWKQDYVMSEWTDYPNN